MSVPLSRLGSHLGNGSGDIALLFNSSSDTTSISSGFFLTIQEIHEKCIDFVF